MALEFVDFNLNMEGIASPVRKNDWLDWSLTFNNRIGNADTVSELVHVITQSVVAQEMLLSNGHGIKMGTRQPLQDYCPRVEDNRRHIHTKTVGQPLYTGQLYFYRYLNTNHGEVVLRSLTVPSITPNAPAHTLGVKGRLDENTWPTEELQFTEGSPRSYVTYRLETPAGEFYGATMQTPIAEGGVWDSFRSIAALALSTNLTRFC